jgi:hypothetical protein
MHGLCSIYLAIIATYDHIPVLSMHMIESVAHVPCSLSLHKFCAILTVLISFNFI